MRSVWISLVLIVAVACKQESPKNTLFEKMTPGHTHVDFTNSVSGDDELNIFNYRNFYNGGGVAIGDVNNDSLPDLFLISNMGKNQLYINKGGFEFENVTEKAGIGGTRAWSTGATMADVNGDGYLDIYVCNAGNRVNDDRSNELFINNGDLTFTEQAEKYKVADKGFSTHAAFFDYDRDGDLDMYLLNNSFIPVGKLQYQNLRPVRDSLGGHKLFRNDGESFTDVSVKAGIYGSVISFGLGITIGDFNNDNWLDVYISNDFYERDYLYINNHDGTFKEDIKNQIQHISLSSMGADCADINNDGTLDIFVTDMLPGDDRRLKLTMSNEGYDLYQLKLNRDYHHQLTQNTLQLNNGNGTFSEVARLSGVHATDWSWGALLFDMDNDGNKDIFVANGIYKDLTDQDFINFLSDETTMRQVVQEGRFDFRTLQDKMTSTPLSSYAFKNEGNLAFTNEAKSWGLSEPGFSNGGCIR
ncbi:MAG: VCBS repeat-containing protein [Bacteroidota bacterium]